MIPKPCEKPKKTGRCGKCTPCIELRGFVYALFETGKDELFVSSIAGMTKKMAHGYLSTWRRHTEAPPARGGGFAAIDGPCVVCKRCKLRWHTEDECAEVNFGSAFGIIGCSLGKDVT